MWSQKPKFRNFTHIVKHNMLRGIPKVHTSRSYFVLDESVQRFRIPGFQLETRYRRYYKTVAFH